MASHGILHQTSCVYTPQQNGVANVKIDILLKQLALFSFMERFLNIFG